MKKQHSVGKRVADVLFVAILFILNSVVALAEDNYPAMWRVGDADTTIYLFGSLHILPPGIEWESDVYFEAMASSTTTITEADTDDPQMVSLVQELGLNPSGVTLTDTLGPERAQSFAMIALELGMPMEILDSMRPWLAQVSLTVAALEKAGFSMEQGVESVVIQQARSEKDEIAYLETAAFQIEMLASLDVDEMLAHFDVSMTQFKDFRTYIDELLDAWKTGDQEALAEKIIDDLRQLSPGAYDAMIVNRNRSWADEIDQLIDGNGRYFIAVGCGHLVGEDSVINMLRERGYSVDRVQ